MQRDFSPGGRGAKFLDQVRREAANGKVQPMEEGFGERRRQRP